MPLLPLHQEAAGDYLSAPFLSGDHALAKHDTGAVLIHAEY